MFLREHGLLAPDRDECSLPNVRRSASLCLARELLLGYTTGNPPILFDDIEGENGVWSTTPSAQCLANDVPAGTGRQGLPGAAHVRWPRAGRAPGLRGTLTPCPVPNEVHGNSDPGCEEGSDTPGGRMTAAVSVRMREDAS